MPRSVSLTTMQGLLAQETSEVFLELIEIDHADLGTPIRLVNDKQDVESNGDIYTAFPFKLALPDEDETKMPEVELIITSVDQSIPNAMRSITSNPTVQLSLIRVSAPDTIEIGPLDFEVTDVEIGMLDTRLRLGFNKNFFAEQFPKDRFAPYNQ